MSNVLFSAALHKPSVCECAQVTSFPQPKSLETEKQTIAGCHLLTHLSTVPTYALSLGTVEC